MSLQVTVDTSLLESLVAGLRLAPKIIADVQVQGINEVGERANREGRRRIVASVNLTPTYVRDRMYYVQAKKTNPKAVIYARMRPTTLATFGAQQLTTSAPRAKGDPRRGIPAGRKQAGVSVAVKQGPRRNMPLAFLIPLRNQNGKMGVFTRHGTDKKAIRHRYGPSVDQVFSNVARDMQPGIQADLSYTIPALARAAVAKALRGEA